MVAPDRHFTQKWMRHQINRVIVPLKNIPAPVYWALCAFQILVTCIIHYTRMKHRSDMIYHPDIIYYDDNLTFVEDMPQPSLNRYRPALLN